MLTLRQKDAIGVTYKDCTEWQDCFYNLHECPYSEAPMVQGKDKYSFARLMAPDVFDLGRDGTNVVI